MGQKGISIVMVSDFFKSKSRLNWKLKPVFHWEITVKGLIRTLDYILLTYITTSQD